MYDLHVPRTAYEKQIQQLRTQIVAIDENDLVCGFPFINY